MILWINSIGVLFDGVSWMQPHLRLLGINPREILSNVITHIHEDHSNIIDMIFNGHKCTVITTKVIWEMFKMKMVKVLNISKKEVEKLVSFVEVVPGKILKRYGAQWDFWYTVHSIPTIGVQVSVGENSIICAGDTIWGEKLAKLVELNVISQEKRKEIMEIPERKSDLTIMDAGGGLIHPLIDELARLSEQVKKYLVLTHIGAIPPEFQQMFRLMHMGKTYTIIPQQPKINDLLILSKMPLLEGAKNEWVNVLFSQGKIEEYSPKTILIKQGDPGKKFCILLAGTVEVLVGEQQDEQQIALLSPGDFFGDFSLLQNAPCIATIKSISPVRLLTISKKIYLEFVVDTFLDQKLRKIYDLRPLLMEIALFKNLSAENINWIIERVKKQSFKAGEIIVRQESMGDNFYLILDGKVGVYVQVNGEIRHVADLSKNQSFGEKALLEPSGVRMATVIASIPTNTLLISKEVFQEMLEKIPYLSVELGLVANRRKKDTAQKIRKAE